MRNRSIVSLLLVLFVCLPDRQLCKSSGCLKPTSMLPLNAMVYPTPRPEDGGLKLTNRDFDPGRQVSPGEYALSDRTYDKLVVKPADKRFDGLTTDIRQTSMASMML